MPFERDGLFVGSTRLVVKDLKVHREAAGEEPCHDGVVGGNAVGVSFSLERLLQNQIAISMIGNHYVLVAGAGLDRKPTGVVGVKFADGNDLNVEVIGVQHWHVGHDRPGIRGRSMGFGRSDILALLGQVA